MVVLQNIFVKLLITEASIYEVTYCNTLEIAHCNEQFLKLCIIPHQTSIKMYNVFALHTQYYTYQNSCIVLHLRAFELLPQASERQNWH